MVTVWIVHRDPKRRAALNRLAAASGVTSGGPGDPLFDAAPAPDVVVLGLGGDLEAELQFAHRTSGRYPEIRWILVAERSDAAAARELFDSIDAEILTDPPDARVLRSHLRAIPPRGTADRLPLSSRPARDTLSERFARWFADLELPELLRALDPHLGDVPLLILGEAGTGRGLLARYTHSFGAASTGPFAHVACDSQTRADDLRDALAGAAGSRAGRGSCTIWLEDADCLAPPLQRQLARWIEFGGASRSRIARWIATVGDGGEALDPVLRDVLGGITLRIPPVRERTHFVTPFANDTALAWCSARRQRPRRFGEDAALVLEEYPWPGNRRELEAVVLQTLAVAVAAADPIRADDLQYQGVAFAPLDAAEIGTLIDAEEVESLTPRPSAPVAAAPPSETEPTPAASTPPPEPDADRGALVATFSEPALQHLVAAVAHEIRNPLTTIQTFAALLPTRFEDPEFRSQFAELVGRDTQRLEAIVQRLAEFASLSAPNQTSVDVAGLLDQLLEERRERVHSRQLLVLKELDLGGPAALGDAGQLRFALESLLDESLALAPERGDMYIASKHHETGLRGAASVRVLVRFGARAGGPKPDAGVPGVSAAENSLAFAIVEAIVRAQGGTFAVDADGDETVVLLDIPA